MLEIIVIEDSKSQLYIDLEEGEVTLTNDIQSILTFKDVDDAKQFIEEYKNSLNNGYYDIVTLKISIREEVMETIQV